MTDRPKHNPEDWTIRTPPDRRPLTFYDPGKGPWSAPVPGGAPTDAERMRAVAGILRRAAHMVNQADLPQTAEDTADFCDGARWATAEMRLIAEQVTAEDPGLRPDGFTELAARLGLNPAERAVLRFALELAEERMLSRGDEFAAVDHAALASLKRFAGEEVPGDG